MIFSGSRTSHSPDPPQQNLAVLHVVNQSGHEFVPLGWTLMHALELSDPVKMDALRYTILESDRNDLATEFSIQRDVSEAVGLT